MKDKIFKKLLLTSASFKNSEITKAFLDLFNKELSQIKVLFIPTAANSKGAWRYVEKSREELKSLGIKLENIFELDCDKAINEDELEDIGLIYVCGGNTFHLLCKLRESGFDKKIIELVNGGVVYVGVSAGSILAGPNIEISGSGSDRDPNKVDLKDLSALNLTNKIVFPHYTDKEKVTIDKLKKKYKDDVIPLTDEQALLIRGDKVDLIGKTY